MVRRAPADPSFASNVAAGRGSGHALPAPSVARYAKIGCIATALAVLPAPVAAQQPASDPEPEQVQLDYFSDPGCPSKAQFVNEVTARIRRPVAWVAVNGTFNVVVSLREVGGEATGRLDVARAGAETTRRDFTATSCHEVGSALALVVALALDPNARTEPLPPAELAEPAAPAEATPLPAPSAAPPPAVVSAPAASSRPPAPPPATPRSPPLRYSIWSGPVIGMDSGYAPEPLVTVGASVGVRVRLAPSFSPALQFTPLWGRTGSIGPAAALATFTWSMARLEACPFPVALATPLTLAPCVAGELGRLSARGKTTEVYESTVSSRFWGSAGATLALHLNLGSWFVRWGGEAVFPLTRDEFVLRDPDQSVHRASPVAWGGRLAVGFQLDR